MLFMLSRQLRLLPGHIQRPVAPPISTGVISAARRRRIVSGPTSFSSAGSQIAYSPDPSVKPEAEDCNVATNRETSDIPSRRSNEDPRNPLTNYFSQPRGTQTCLINTDQSIPTREPDHLEFSEHSQTWKLQPWQLDLESDLGHSLSIGSKLVDNPHNAQDFSLWRELVLYRQRHYGDTGVIDIWKGLTERCSGIRLPTEGKDADFLWETFVSIGLKHEWILKELQSHAESIWKEKGLRWKYFYECVVGSFVKAGNQPKALLWHQALKHTHLDNPEGILCVFKTAMSTGEGLDIFRRLCQLSDGHRIYSFVVPILCKHKSVGLALAMHYFLMRRGDFPSSIEDVLPLIQHVQKYSNPQQQSHFLTGLIKSGTLPVGTSIDSFSSHSSQICSATSNTTGTQSPMVKDDLGARLFATKTFTFDLILGGLKMFGVGAIGPLTLQQMALKAVDIAELQHQISQLKEIGISTGNSVFAKAVDYFIARKDHQALHDLIHSDQHPDALESLETQESLFHHFSMRLISEILEKMKADHISPSKKTIKWMIWNILPSRRMGTRPILDRPARDAVLRLFGIFQYVIKYGGYIPPESWEAGLKQLIISNRWSELERLCLWLAETYSPQNHTQNSQIPNIRLPPTHPQSPLRIIFSVDFQQAIINCGFLRKPKFNFSGPSTLNPFGPTPDPVALWVCGLILLRRLKEKGVYINTNTVRRVCRTRLAILFGDGPPSKRKSNLLLRRVNPWTLDQIIADANKVWGSSLFSDFTPNIHKLVNPRRRPITSQDHGMQREGKH
ncbi:hypothetical protein TEQG_04702 [Trichophyton equinum CBS 127.97]|uniref:Uncharacterized protein n=1 Tax=Trichophyton equinum (strain ATCC MYA-4606 / CBS 127.97) TaxID=559882 RepID=F2PUX6_TRIEC|nr:hypothetical protein TEQG_04702 [Trichophyton equinum CBS 127.97]